MGMSTFSFSILLFAIFVLIISYVIPTIGTFTSSSYFGGESLSPHKAYAHMPIGNISRIQNWTHPDNKIGIQFTYEPEKPIIDAFTELKFSVQNTTTGQHISDTEDAVARVVVTNGQRLFKFENISVDDGHFSVKYLFPDDGTHQAITRLDTERSVNLALFNIFVPHQSLPSGLNPFPSSSSPTTEVSNVTQQVGMIAIIVGGIGGVFVATIFLIKRK
jgi:hypothetical protein